MLLHPLTPSLITGALWVVRFLLVSLQIVDFYLLLHRHKGYERCVVSYTSHVLIHLTRKPLIKCYLQILVSFCHGFSLSRNSIKKYQLQIFNELVSAG